jgi:hypothetical protein
MPSSTTTRNRRQRDEPPTLADLAKIVDKLAEGAKEKTEQDKNREKVLHNLNELGMQSVQEGGISYAGTRIQLPAVMEGNLDSAIGYLMEVRDAEEEEIEFGRTFDYRPYDGAAAFQRAMQRLFGTSGVGKAFWTMFGKVMPQLISIPVGPGQNLQVPWNQVRFEPLDCTFMLHATRDPKKGLLFRLDVTAPKKWQRQIEGFFDILAIELAERSIYRGKMVDGSDNPDFIDPFLVDARQVCYSQNVLTQLNANVWTVLEHSNVLRNIGQSLKRAVLLEGEYGTGKTLTGSLTAQYAVRNGWTFILVKAGQDPYLALRTASLYSPAVVWVEDLDVLSEGQERSEITKLLDALDGVAAKGIEIFAGFTTNFAKAIDKAVLRPGRVDAVIHFGALDSAGFERLVRSHIPTHLLDEEVDFAAVATAMEGYVPAFAVEAVGRAIRYSVARNGGDPDVITTADLVEASEGLRDQYLLQQEAKEASHGKPTIQSLLREEMAGVLKKFEVEDVGVLVEHSNGE